MSAMKFIWMATSMVEIPVDLEQAQRLHRMHERVKPNPFNPIPGPYKHVYDFETIQYDFHGKVTRIQKVGELRWPNANS